MTDDEPSTRPADEDRTPRPARPTCPSCGSTHTQPFTFAGAGARVNMKCIDCGHLFKDPPRSR